MEGNQKDGFFCSKFTDSAPVLGAMEGNQKDGFFCSKFAEESQANRLVVDTNQSSNSTPITVNGCEVSSPGAKCSAGKKLKPRYKRRKRPHGDPSAPPQPSHIARDTVESILMTFDALRRRLAQINEVSGTSLIQRPDLKAGTIMLDADLWANTVKGIGQTPGIDVGDIFYFRKEMCLVGLHTQTISGIDFKKLRFAEEEDLVAICIVSSGGYENVEGDMDILVYTGQGEGDQKIEGGNLALERSSMRGNEIRVVRSVKDPCSQSGKIYIYDGVYKISKKWVVKENCGHDRLKYKLLREPGQPDGMAVWKMTQKWKENPSTRDGVILPDMTSGVETLPVCLVNLVDGEKGPSYFTYATRVTYPNPISSKTLQACMCDDICHLGNANCSCVQRSGGDPPFILNGVLVSCNPLIFECNASCRCSINCRSRVTQKGVKLHFEVFRTRDRGWGLRSWDAIRAGTFICEYIGEVIDNMTVGDNGEEDEYLFHTSNADSTTFKWNFGRELNGDPSLIDPAESFKQMPIILSAKWKGNVSRFMNHSCSPNVFWQPVLYDHGDEGYPHFMFFAIKHIPPMTELTYDYGTSGAETDTMELRSGDGSCGLKKCLCGSLNCRGLFG